MSPLRKPLALLLVTALLAPGLGFFPARRALAVDAVTVVGGQGTVYESISASADASTAASTQSLVFKETVLDPLAWVAAKAIVRAMSRSIINWINNGFNGNPAFVTDLDGFLTDIADKVIGDFIYGTELGFLCSPFQLQIRLALARQYRPFRDRNMCRLSSVVRNIDQFLAGDFSQGGWNGWYQLVTGDNIYNRYLEADVELSARVANARGRELRLLDWGRGFMSWQECTEQPAGGVDCKIVTPGSYIEQQLVNVAGEQFRELGLADELNEILSALASQLLSQTLGGAGGLRGVSQNYGGRPSFLDAMVLQPVGTSGGWREVGTSSSTQMGTLISQEQAYRTHASIALSRTLQSEALIAQLRSCDSARAESLVSIYITPIKTELEQKIALADQNVAALRSLDLRLAQAITAEQIQSINTDLGALVQSGDLHDISETINEQQRSGQIVSSMSGLDQQVQPEVTSCLTRSTSGGQPDPITE